ncbi:MAG: SGNH/GDSL hydrolase family protein [Vicinamibacterales bacterium]
MHAGPSATLERNRTVLWLTLSAVLWLAGCGGSGGTGPSPVSNEYRYTTVGASDAIGVGASVPCFPFTACPDGTGYVQTIARRLRTDTISVKLTNLGLPAAVLGPGFQKIGATYGREIPGNFLEQELPFVPRDSTHVTIFAGGNDTNTLVAAVGAGAGGGDPMEWVDARIQEFANDYLTLVKGIRERAPNATIVVANLPNFAGMPFMAAHSADRRQLAQYISVNFTIEGINKLANQGIPVVDMLCNPMSYDPSTYSSDGFHPGDAGYAYLAGEMLQAFANPGGYRRPAASCSFMTLVPPL